MASVHQVHVRNGEDCVEEVEETLLRASAGLSSLTDKVIMEYLQFSAANRSIGEVVQYNHGEGPY